MTKNKLNVLFNRMVGKRGIPHSFAIGSIVAGARAELISVDSLLTNDQITESSRLENDIIAQDNQVPTDGPMVFYGILHGNAPLFRYALKHNLPYYYIDHAYFSRGHSAGNYKITKNNVQAGPIVRRPSDRFDEYKMKVKDWHKGDHIIVCPPSNHMRHFWNVQTWLEDTLETLKKHTDRPIIVRNKPKKNQKVEPLDLQLNNAHAVVTFNSNVTTEAVLAGVPVFCDPMCTASQVGLTDLSKIEEPIYPERQPWLNHLAYSQFSLREMLHGFAWRTLQET